MKLDSYSQPIRRKYLKRSCALLFVFLSIFFTLFASGNSNSQDILTPAERNWLSSNKSRIVLAVETGYAPFVFIDSNGQPSGLANDYILLLESKLGVHFQQRRFSSLSEIFEKVHSGEVQIVNAVTSTPERSRFLTMTDPYISVPNVIIVRKDHAGQIPEYELSGLKVSLVKNYAITEHMINRGLHIVPDLVPDDLTALLNVSFGRTDATIIDLATASYLISAKGITNLRVAGEVSYDIRLAIGSPIDEPQLHSILQKGLNAITDTERQEIRTRWISASSQSILRDRRFWTVLVSVLFIGFGIIGVVLTWNRTLRRQVAIRTEALAKEQEALKESEAQKLALVTKYNQELERQIAERTTELSSANLQLQQLSEIDGLTGVANRRKLDIALDIEWRRAIRDREPLAFLMLDIDHFKEYNDHYGHQAGDACLQQVAEIITSSAQRAGELVARYGGEEFAVVLPNHNSTEAMEIAESIRLAIESKLIQHPLNKPKQIVTISIGVASCVPDQGQSPSTLLQQADSNLYRAKHEGRNRTVSA